MSTRSLIGVAEQNGTVKAIYCHFDGYVEYVGKVLNAHYNSEALARQLLALGDLSSLDERIAPAPGEKHSFENPAKGVTVAYHRDRGEKFHPAQEYASVEELATSGASDVWAEYCYVWKDGAWHVSPAGSRFYGTRPVADVLAEIEKQEG